MNIGGRMQNQRWFILYCYALFQCILCDPIDAKIKVIDADATQEMKLTNVTISTQIIEIDARPSDCITLSLMHNTPIFCKKEIIEKAIPVEI